MSKKYSIFITALFCLFIFGFGIALIVSPSRDFSEQENRYLAQFKAPTLKTLRSGEFMEDFEDYVVDQFPLRDGWIQLKALSEVALGKQENNGVYFGTNHQTLFAQFNAPSPEELEKRTDYVNSLGDKAGVPVYFALIPDKTYAWAEDLPENAPNVDDGSTIARARELCGENARFIDLSRTLGYRRDVEPWEDYSFYRTDHHWTTVGARLAFQALMEGMGLQTADLSGLPLTEVNRSFYGTTWSSSGAGWIHPDRIETIVPEGGTKGHVTVTGYPEGKPVESSLYHPDKLEVKDKYAFFLGGNQPLCVIKNPDAAGGKLLVVRDSYADALAPFLAEEFQEVHLLDLRYYNLPVSQYAQANGIDTILVLYAGSNFGSDNNLFKLAM